MLLSKQPSKVQKEKSTPSSRLVESLAFRKVIKSEAVANVMRRIDRGDFTKQSAYTYSDM